MNLSGGPRVYTTEQWLSRVAGAVESGRNCIKCGECELKCPYQLPIREMIVENIANYERIAAEHAAQQEQ